MMQDVHLDVAEQGRPASSITVFEHRFEITCYLRGVSVNDVVLDSGDGVLGIVGKRAKSVVEEGVLVAVNQRAYGMFR